MKVEVLLASTTSAPQARSRSANTRCFRTRFSLTASITRSAPATASGSEAHAVTRCIAAAQAAGGASDRSARVSAALRMFARPCCSAAAEASVIVTRRPATANSSAMPCPIRPAPITATRSIAAVLSISVT